MRTLLLLRQAKSAWPDGVDDEQRPLASRGRAAAPLVGRHLRDEGVGVDRVLVSSARRTRETWALLSDAWGSAVEAIVEPRIYAAGVEELLALVRAQPASASALMLVGHNPGMADLTRLLADPAASDAAALGRSRQRTPTASIATLTFREEDWPPSPGQGRLVSFVTPGMLGDVDED